MTPTRPQLLADVRCAVYARFSSDRQKDTSIVDQVRRCRDYIVASGGQLDPALVFTDCAVSGASLQRAGMEALRELVNRREIDVIVVEDQSRIARDFADSGTIFKQLDYHRVRLLCVADGLDCGLPRCSIASLSRSIVTPPLAALGLRHWFVRRAPVTESETPASTRPSAQSPASIMA